MEAPDWEACSFELARTLVGATSRDLANAQLSAEEEARSMMIALGFHRAKKAIRRVGAARLSVMAQWATRLPHTKDLARRRSLATQDLVCASRAVGGNCP